MDKGIYKTLASEKHADNVMVMWNCKYQLLTMPHVHSVNIIIIIKCMPLIHSFVTHVDLTCHVIQLSGQ